MHKRYGTWLALGALSWLAGIVAQESPDEPPPELDFLEYLGAWAAEDDEWLVIEEWRKDNPEQAPDADDEDTEHDDEDEERE